MALGLRGLKKADSTIGRDGSSGAKTKNTPMNAHSLNTVIFDFL
jgi:hypothetical protein